MVDSITPIQQMTGIAPMQAGVQNTAPLSNQWNDFIKKYKGTYSNEDLTNNNYSYSYSSDKNGNRIQTIYDSNGNIVAKKVVSTALVNY